MIDDNDTPPTPCDLDADSAVATWGWAALLRSLAALAERDTTMFARLSDRQRAARMSMIRRDCVTAADQWEALERV